MTWSTAEVCRISGVTSRTLRHYHRIGLLVPESTGPGGIRRYGAAELLRLQRVLVMRELGMGLADIARVLDEGLGEADALRTHLDALEAERDRLDSLVTTVRRTLNALEGDNVSEYENHPEKLFEGLDTAAYSEQARTRWPEQWEQARRATEEYTDTQLEQTRAESTAQMLRMGAHLTVGTPVTDPAVQAEVHIHYQSVSRMWTPDAEAYTNLGRTFAEEGDWREAYESVVPGLAEYQRDAMAVYAREHLTPGSTGAAT